MIAQFTIPQHELLALMPLVEADAVHANRLVLAGINIEVKDKNCVLVATNGRALGILNVGHVDTADFSAVVDTSMVRHLKPRRSRYGRPSKLVTVSVEESEVRFSMSGSVVGERLDAVACEYPRWRNLIPQTDITSNSELDVTFDYLWQFAEVGRLLCRSTIMHVRKHNAENAPYSVWLSDPRFYGLLMPATCNVKLAVPKY